MGRTPIGRRAMTPAQRQRRRRKRLRKEQGDYVLKVESLRQRYEKAKEYIPSPPGITYYESIIIVTPEGERSIFVPKTRPLAACGDDLEDEDVMALLERLEAMAKERGLLSP